MPSKQYDKLIQETAQANGLDPALFRAQLVQESGLNPEAVSKAGALGIGQIIPKWWMGKHGLNTIEDFKDPEKSIKASGAIMAQHIKTYGGWNQALVAYNAGQGKDNVNINAYNSGELHKLPKETQDYLSKLGVKDQMPVVSTPEVKGMILANTPEVQPLGRGQLDATPGARFDSPEQGLAESFMAGMRQSPIGTALRLENPLAVVSPTNYQFSSEDLEELRNANIGEAGVRFVMRNAQKQEDIKEMIQVARENREAAQANRSLVGGLVFGAGEMLGDPVTYGSMVIPGGIYAKTASLYSGPAARIAAGAGAVALEGALTNAASESLREGTTGVDADYAGAMAAGAVFSVGLLGAGKLAGAGFDSIKRGIGRAESSQTAEVLRGQGLQDVTDPSIVQPQQLDDMVPGWRNLPFKDPSSAVIKLPSGDYVHPASGVQFSSHNPLNPVNNDAPVDINVSGFTGAEVGDVLAGSADADFKQAAWSLLRTSRGYADGTSGRFSATAQDVDVNMRGKQVEYQGAWDAARKEAMDDPSLLGSQLSYVERKRLVDERVMRAVDSGDLSGLTPAERKAAEVRMRRYAEFANEQVNPGARWGVNAPKLLDQASVKENYQPVVYNEMKVNNLREELGDDVLQDRIARSFYGSYLADAEVKDRTDAYLQSIGATFDAEEYARRVAFGIVNQGESLNVGRLNITMEAKQLSVADMPDFRKMRSTFGYNHEIDLPGGERFSVNDLRSWDADLIDAAYFNRVKGDIAMAVATGRDPEMTREWLGNMRAKADADANLKKEMMALDKVVGGLYGVGIRNQGERSKAIQGIFQDLAFMKSSAYMGVMNFTEIAAGIVRGGLGFAGRAMPGFGKFIQNLQRGKTTAETVRTAQNAVWGSGLDRVIIPTYAETIERTTRGLYQDSGVNRVNTMLGAARGATQASVDKWWTSRVLNATQGSIIEAARQDFFADLAGFALAGRKTSFVNPKRMREASVDQRQMDDVVALLRETVKIGPDGQMDILDANKLANDPRAAALRRYGQFWSERVIQQNTLGSTFRWSHLPLVGMFTQFMSFVTRSVNSKLIRGNSDIIRNGNVGELMSLYVVGGAMGALQYAGVTYLQSTKFPNEADRKKFLQERFGEGDDWGPLAAGAVKRMPVMAGPGWLYDTIGTSSAGQAVAPEVFQYAGLGKTSTEAKLKAEARNQAGPVGGYLGDAVEQAPAVKMLDSILGAAAGGAKQAMAETYDERKLAVQQWTRALKGLVPNDPVSQRGLLELFQAADVQ